MSDEAPIDRSPEPAASTSKPSAEIVHAMRGRVRLRIPEARNNPGLLHRVRAAFDGQPGIDTIEVNPVSCGLVIYYDPDHHRDVHSLFVGLDDAVVVMASSPATAQEPRQAASAFDETISAIEEESEALAAHSEIAASIVDSVAALNRQIKRSTGNRVDLEFLAPAGLAAITFLEIGAAAATPMWVTLMVFSIGHFVQLRSRDADKPHRLVRATGGD